MENATMGPIVVPAKIENLSDEWLAAANLREPARIRTLVVSDAIVDPRLTRLSLSRPIIEQLGLMWLDSEDAKVGRGNGRSPIYGPARLTVQGRYCTVDVVELHDGRQVVIGHVPLTLMDWVVDRNNQRLIGNPAHGGDWMFDMYLASSHDK